MMRCLPLVPLFVGFCLVAEPATAAPPVPAGAADVLAQFHAAVLRCWNPPPKATGSVVVHVELGPDGAVIGRPKVNGLASAGVAKAALHAVTFCQPYHLPKARYSDWQHATVELSATETR